MKKQKRRRAFWWILLGVLLVLLIGYVFKNELAQNHEVTTSVPAQQSAEAKSSTSTVGSPTSTGTTPSNPDIRHSASSSTEKEALTSQTGKKVDYCEQIENDVRNFFSYLDNRPYIQHLELGKPVLKHVRDMVRRLSAHSPVPAGEGIDPRILTQNIYHLYRTLGLRDIRLVREVLRNEKDSLEINMDIFYRWLMAGDRCPDHLGVRPPFKVLYRYAGFFINTIGGRACLSRRMNLARLLITYYCLLTVHQADIRGLNTYGIDIYPFVISLKNEIAHYHDLEFQSEYLERLTRMERYYIEKR